MILIRENVERVTSDPLVIDRLKKEGFKEYEPGMKAQSENNPEEQAEEVLEEPAEEMPEPTDPPEPKRKRSVKKGGTVDD